MNELTYQLLADVSDEIGEDIYGWHIGIANRTREPEAVVEARILGYIRELLEADLIGLGSIEADEAGRGVWMNWLGEVDELVQRAAARYGRSDTVWNLLAAATPRGVRIFEAEEARREAAGQDPWAHVNDRFGGIWDEDGSVIEPHGDEIVV
ncbi:hypothetical protein SAMN02800687_1684 [Curtobacterium sp. UNCCL20]|uniref:hypothetical protein n=1 Tax=Curtobacterium sp. UNCCL20 TaxID=1502773 RepID=UPI00088D4C27|nr:hypothetical protein [Curtobacterium sp. UNCCL20]SDQ38818.1 hypothetical protein SAMN02800687_1684 [Curtobacterium sp. UNCCL20]